MSLFSNYCKRIGVLCLVLLAALACSQKQDEVPEHEPTEEELIKLHLEESFATFFSTMELEESADIREYLVRHSVVSVAMDKSIIYNLRQNGVSLIWLRFTHHDADNWNVNGDMYGGVEFHGTLQPLAMYAQGPSYWEELSDIHVYDNGKDVAKLGLEVYDLGYIPVLRFPDGTSYSITTLVLIEPLMDYLLKHVLSTE